MYIVLLNVMYLLIIHVQNLAFSIINSIAVLHSHIKYPSIGKVFLVMDIIDSLSTSELIVLDKVGKGGGGGGAREAAADGQEPLA